MPRKKIIYVIATFGHGQGGHFRDLREISADQSRSADCLVVNIGPQRSSVLEGGPVRVETLDTGSHSMFQVIQKLRAIAAVVRPDIINVYDMRVYVFARLLKGRAPVPLVITKCGGGTPRWFYPASDALVVFSRENQTFFSGRRRQRNGPIFFCPNRVKAPIQDKDLIAEVAASVETKSVGVILIGRLTEAYRATILTAIGLNKRLNADGKACHLFIVGVPEAEDVVAQIKSCADEHITLLTDACYTENAAKLIDLAEISISAGLGLMEAAALGKVLITTIGNASMPSLVNATTFEELFRTNFSPRNALADNDEDARYNLIATVVQSSVVRMAYSEQSQAFFKDYFDVNGVAELYDRFYETLPQRRSMSLMSLLWGAYVYYRSRLD
jgi:glycosyltransferase involved in cell wall biosynthesis